MDRLWKILLAAVVVAILWFSWQRSQDETARALRVRALAECFNRNDFRDGSPPDNARAGFFRALAQLQQNVSAEPPPGLLHRSAHDASWYLDEALAPLEVGDTERTLIKAAMINGYNDARTAGAYDESVGREAMAAGREPTMTRGTFAGEVLRVGWRVSPVLIPEMLNHPANFKLMPGVAWGLQQERIDEGSTAAAREFFRAGILSREGWELVQGYQRDAKKND